MTVVENTEVIPTIRRRWRSGQHVGDARPAVRAYVRSGHMVRKFRAVGVEDVYSQVPGITGRRIWQGKWEPRTAYTDLPNVKDFEITQNFEENGVAQATIILDNIGMVEKTGVAGLYHLMQRGHYAPFRGYKPPGRPAIGARNSWYDILHDSSSQIILLGGYGDAVMPLFLGLINDVDSESRPDQITLTCRDMGQFLTDQHVFINAKVRHVPDPITFADRREAENVTEQGHGARASSSDPQHPARLVRHAGSNSFWQSRGNHHRSAVEWVEISVPAGRYDSIAIHPQYVGQEAWIAIDANGKNAPGGHGATRRFDHPIPEGWIHEGRGQVPGTDVPFIRHIPKLKEKERVYTFPEYGYMLGDNSRIRIYISKLDYGAHGQHSGRDYRAGLIRLVAFRRRTKKEAKRDKWILVDDISDIVRTVFQWAGINEWEVETTGVRLKRDGHVVFNRGDFLVDIINRVRDSVGYVFYMKPPDHFDEDNLDIDHNLTTGIGVFRPNQAMSKRPRDHVELVHEDQVLKGISAKFSDASLSYNIRVRGKMVKASKGGVILQGDKVHRYMYVYNPPWSRNKGRGIFAFGGANVAAKDNFRNGNLKKYVVHHDDKLRSIDDCKVMAIMIAFREALESAQVQIEAPAMPSIFLDHHTALYDTGTGLSTRFWVATRTIHYTSGEDGQFVMTLGGGLTDFPDIVAVRQELQHVLRDKNYSPGLGRWGRDVLGPIIRNTD